MFFKIGVLKNFVIFTGKTPVNIAKSLRTVFSQNTSGGCFWRVRWGGREGNLLLPGNSNVCDFFNTLKRKPQRPMKQNIQQQTTCMKQILGVYLKVFNWAVKSDTGRHCWIGQWLMYAVKIWNLLVTNPSSIEQLACNLSKTQSVRQTKSWYSNLNRILSIFNI